MLSPKNILSINNLSINNKESTQERHSYYKGSAVLPLGKNKRLEPECSISYHEYLLSKCTNNCNINGINHLGRWS